jgi:hypothetical protein
VGGRGWSVLAKPRFSYRNVKRHRGFPAVQAMLVVWLRLALTTVGNSATEVRYCIIDRGLAHCIIGNATRYCLQGRVVTVLGLERVINFSTLSAMIYGRPLPLRDLVNFLDGTKSLSK